MTLSTRRPSAFTFKEGDELKQALEAAASALNSTDDTAKVVQRLVELAARALRVKGAAVLLFSRDRSEIFPVAARGLSRRYLAKGPLLAEVACCRVYPAQGGLPGAGRKRVGLGSARATSSGPRSRRTRSCRHGSRHERRKLCETGMDQLGSEPRRFADGD